MERGCHSGDIRSWDLTARMRWKNKLPGYPRGKQIRAAHRERCAQAVKICVEAPWGRAREHREERKLGDRTSTMPFCLGANRIRTETFTVFLLLSSSYQLLCLSNKKSLRYLSMLLYIEMDYILQSKDTEWWNGLKKIRSNHLLSTWNWL